MRWVLPVVAALAAFGARALPAQLISPGKLTAAHSALEGIRHCTECHQLRERGVASANCLDCHTPLRRRIEEGTGYHARLTDRNCAECHKEHFGTDFRLVRLDSARFDHAETGYQLKEAHAALSCRECHTPTLIVAADVRDTTTRTLSLARTFLGLATTCAGCHVEDDPHGRQFAGRACEECHSEREWKPAPKFDHDATKYPLTGRHTEVACAECHRPLPGARAPRLRYAGLAFGACTACHDDPHRNRMGADCARCHSTGGWRGINRTAFERGFDHAKTGFRLLGKHADAQCAACHDRRQAVREGIRLHFAAAPAGAAYPKPARETCLSCHLDYHGGEFTESPGGAGCDNCHAERGWIPTTYDLARHQRAAFTLEGAHAAVPCFACHRVTTPEGDRLEFHTDARACSDCHTENDPHVGQFRDRECDECHMGETFRIAAFDHSRTRFPLDGRHRDVECADCHVMVTAADGREFRRYRPVGTQCRDCHTNR